MTTPDAPDAPLRDPPAPPGATVVLSAGGTGGHVMPAAALAADLVARGLSVQVLTDARGLAYARAFPPGVPVTALPAAAPAGGLLQRARAALALAAGAARAWLALRRVRPALVVGFGGYPSVPGVWAAQRLGLRTVVHEQNAVLGRANAFLAPRAERIALSWPVPQSLDEADAVRCVITGNPVRAEIAALATTPYPAPEADGPLRVLVLGGSLGAGVFGDVVPAALTSLPEAVRARLRVAQQCRGEDMARVEAAYADAGIGARCAPFFDDVAAELAAAHLVIGRAGASMVAEVTAAGRPAIFVPYPHHADNQQAANARAVEAVGGAWVMAQEGFTPAALAARVETFAQGPEILFTAAERAHSIGRPDAARRLGNLVIALARGW
jgi:UDP-N-acetylglucosamine--N-acetylmuramyl-(pentapeptide) pyrophosphoryl-undecaprenol N-acetylglucosamine transferase